MNYSLDEITKGQCSSETFLSFLKQTNKTTLQKLSWNQLPVWKVFLKTNPNATALQEFMMLYDQLGGNLLELNSYKESLFHFHLERAVNSASLSLEILLQCFALTNHLQQVEKDYKALWPYCLHHSLQEEEKRAALKAYQQSGGNLSYKGSYGSIWKYIAELPSRTLWGLVASWIEVRVEEELVIGGEGRARIEFGTFLLEQQVPIHYWGTNTFDHALRDDDLELLEQLLAWGWELPLENPDLLGQTNSIAVFKKLLKLGVATAPRESTYPFDYPVYTLLYNLQAVLERHQQATHDWHSPKILAGKQKLQLLLEAGATLPTVLDYENSYPSVEAILEAWPELGELIEGS